MDDPEQMARDCETQWISLHVRLGGIAAERERLCERLRALDEETAALLDDIAELREYMP
jgi:hypothetical protein